MGRASGGLGTPQRIGIIPPISLEQYPLKYLHKMERSAPNRG